VEQEDAVTRRVSSWGGLLTAATAIVTALSVLILAAPAAAQDGQSVTVQLEAEGDSGVTGTAVLTADGDQTTVALSLQGAEEGYEGHLLNSTCDNHRGATVFYPLNAVDTNGESDTTIDAPLSELATGDFWIHIHRPAGEQGEGVACGQIPAYTGTGGALPATGVGPISSDRSGEWLLVGLVAALSAFGVSMMLRRSGLARG
jgi:hypothetical protein